MLVDRDRIRDKHLDRAASQVLSQLVAPIGSHDVVLVDAAMQLIRARRCDDPRHVRKSFVVDRRQCPSALDPAWYRRKFRVQDGSLEIVEPAREPEQDMAVLPLSSMVPEMSDRLRDTVVVGASHPGIAGRSWQLLGIEAGARHGTEPT